MRRLTCIRPDRFGPKAVTVGFFFTRPARDRENAAIVEQIHVGPRGSRFVPISAQQHPGSLGDPAMSRFPGL